MIVFKNHNQSGFTLIETLLALALFSVVIMPLFRLQTQMLLGSATYSHRMQRIMLGKQYAYEVRKKLQERFQNKEQLTTFSEEKKIKEPETTLKYRLEPVAAKSSVHVFPALFSEQISITWREAGREQQEQLVTYLFKAPEKKAEKKGAL